MWEYRESIFGTTAHKAIDDLHISAYVAPFEGGYLSIVEAQADQSTFFYHRRRFLGSKEAAELDRNAQINFIDSLTSEDFHKVAEGLMEWPNDYSEPYVVKYPHVKKPVPPRQEGIQAAEESGVFDTHDPTSIQDPLPKNRYMGKKHNPKFEAETEKIKENREKPENQKPHPFKAAEWTHPNGHPRCIRCGDEERVGGQCGGYTPGERHFLAMMEGYWINYQTGFEVKVSEHEDWIRNPNNAKSLGIPSSIIEAIPGIQFSVENRTKFLTFLMSNAPIMRVRGHGNQISFEYASSRSKEPLDAVWTWAKNNAGPYSTIYIANLATGENTTFLFKDFEELMNTEGYEGIMRRGSSEEDRIILGELDTTEFLVRQAGSTENYLQSLGVDPSVIQFVTSQEPDIAKRLVNEVRKNVSLTTQQLQQMTQQLSQKQKYEMTQREFELGVAYEDIPGMSKWVILQAKKYRARKVPLSNPASNFPPYEFEYAWPFTEFGGLGAVGVGPGRADWSISAIRNVLNFISDWARAAQPQLSSYDLVSAKEASDKWHKEQAEQGAGQGYEDRNVVYTLKNGWTIQLVKTENDLEVEGNLMGHCVGSYCKQVWSGRSEIYSLRDPKNEPHVTIEVEGPYASRRFTAPPTTPDEEIEQKKRQPSDPWKIIQIQGKGNQEPVPEYKAMIKEWFQSVGPERITSEVEGKGLDDLLYEAEVSQYEDILEGYGEENEYGLVGDNIANLSAEFMESVYDRIEKGLVEQYGKHKLTYIPRAMNSIAYSLADLAWRSDMEKVKNVTREEAIDLLKPKAMGERRNTWPELSAMAGIEKVMDKHQEKFDEWNFDLGLRMEDFGSEDEFLEAEAKIRDQEYESWLPGGFDMAILKRWADRVKWDKERGAKGLWPSQLLQEKAESKW